MSRVINSLPMAFGRSFSRGSHRYRGNALGGRTFGVRHRLLAAGASVAVDSQGDPYPLTD